ncbi:MAG TPA: hypothetical protein P5532_17760 [Planctomycetota bacterium]|nr:hypothetical protein [Planctomycetota bacterium]
MITKRSRYRFSILCQDEGFDFLGNRPQVPTTPRPDDRFHTVVEGDRLDLLAYRYLGDARLWWVIADYNDIFWPLDLGLGRLLRIPSAQHAQMNILG